MVFEDWTNYLKPAICVFNANGRERNPCSFCGKKVNQSEKIVEIVDGCYHNRLNFTRFHHNCFLKVLAMNFQQLLSNKELTKEVVLMKLEN